MKRGNHTKTEQQVIEHLEASAQKGYPAVLRENLIDYVSQGLRTGLSAGRAIINHLTHINVLRVFRVRNRSADPNTTYISLSKSEGVGGRFV